MARLDRQGRLLSASPALLEWHELAGGEDDGALALPGLLSLARKSLRLDMPLVRNTLVSDGRNSWRCWTRIEPEGAEIVLTIDRLSLVSGSNEKGGKSDHENGFLTIQLDPALRIMSSNGPGRTLLDLPTGTGFFDLFELAGDETDKRRLFEAIGERQGLSHFAVVRKGETSVYPLSGQPLIDRSGEFAGYRFIMARPNIADKNVTDDQSMGGNPELGSPNAAHIDRLFGAEMVPALRQPLDRIVANAETLSARLKGPLRSEYADYASDIADAGRHLLSLVGDLSDLEVVESKSFTASADPIDLVDLGHRAAGLLAVKAADHSIRFDLDDESKNVPASGEFRRVLQILVNLIGNAINYGPDGSTIYIRAKMSGDRATISVTDEGPGIDEADRARVFNKFERLGRSGDGGSGLGLYISKRLALAMNGDLDVANTEGKGARFTLTLPAREV